MKKRTATALVTCFTLFGAAVQGASFASAAPRWSLENEVTAIQISRSGQALGVRFRGSEEFTRVDSRIADSAVEGLAFHVRNIPLAVYFIEYNGKLMFGPHYFICWAIFKPVEDIDGPIVVDLETQEIAFPDGQTVKIPPREIPPEEAEIDWGSGPPLLNVDFRRGHSPGVKLKGYYQYTLFEFIDPETEEVISRSVVGEDLLE